MVSVCEKRFMSPRKISALMWIGCVSVCLDVGEGAGSIMDAMPPFVSVVTRGLSLMWRLISLDFIALDDGSV